LKDLNEYFSSDISEHELFAFLHNRILTREITSFSELKDYTAPILNNKRTHPVIMQIFELIKRLYWGFFAAISSQSHPKLWRELVISDKTFPEAGDIKRNLQISNLYVAMLDIHGYTKFCMDSRKNLSMMHILDRAIECEVSRICDSCGAVSQRERGDEIVVIAASASDALMATLGVIDYFGNTDFLGDPDIQTHRFGESAALPAFKVTGGITGGNTTSPLIITEKGNLAGFLLNSGARLQMRANELSPSESRVMIAKQVQMNFEKENAQIKCPLACGKKIYFFDTGHIEFKGVIIPTCEAVFNPDEKYKQKFSEEMNRLFASIKEQLWEQKIFVDTVTLISKVSRVMPKFSVSISSAAKGASGCEQVFTNDSLRQLAKSAENAYVQAEDYILAVSLLQKIIEASEEVPSFDRLVLDYLKGVNDKYMMLIKAYNESIDQQLDANEKIIFQGNSFQVWTAAKRGAFAYEKLRITGRSSPHIAKKKNLWYSLIKQKQNEMVFSLYSGKK